MVCKEILYLLLGIGILLFMGLIIAAVAVILHYINQKKIQELTRYNINLTTTIDETIPTILEQFIQSCLSDWLIITGGYAAENYITEAEEKELRSQLVDRVVERISPNLIDKLSSYYNKINISKIISDKIYIVVTNYVVEHNAGLMKETNEKK